MSNVHQKRKDTNYQIDDDEDSKPFLDKMVEESITYEESSAKLTRRIDFAVYVDEALQEKTSEETEDENKYESLNLLNRNPLISEGNPVSPTDKGLMEEDQEDAFVANSTLDQNLVKAYELLSIDTLYPKPVSQPMRPQGFMQEDKKDAYEANSTLDQNLVNANEFLPIDTSLYSGEPVVSQPMNPLERLPFENLVRDSSYDSNQRKDKTEEFATEYKRHQVSKEASVATTGGSKSDESREYPSEHSRFMVLKHSPKKTFTCCKCGKILHSWKSYENHVHEHDKPSEETSFSLSRDSPTSKTSPNHIYSGTTPKKTGKSRPDQSYSRTTPKKASKIRPDQSYSGTTPQKASKSRLDQSSSGTTSKKVSKTRHDHSLGATPKKANKTTPDHSYSESKPKTPTKKAYPCDKCGKVLSYKRTYENHMLLHTGRKPFVCPECGKAFTLNTYLNYHFRGHTGDQPYVCDVCGRRFVHPSTYSRHHRRHTT